MISISIIECSIFRLRFQLGLKFHVLPLDACADKQEDEGQRSNSHQSHKEGVNVGCEALASSFIGYVVILTIHPNGVILEVKLYVVAPQEGIPKEVSMLAGLSLPIYLQTAYADLCRLPLVIVCGQSGF
jgi:hypothetical protein